MITCECGHPVDDHRQLVLSVPLPPREEGPIYKIQGTIINRYPSATYDTMACGCCTCTSFTTDVHVGPGVQI